MNNDNNLEFCIAGVNCRAGYATANFYSFINQQNLALSKSADNANLRSDRRRGVQI